MDFTKLTLFMQAFFWYNIMIYCLFMSIFSKKNRVIGKNKATSFVLYVVSVLFLSSVFFNNSILYAQNSESGASSVNVKENVDSKKDDVEVAKRKLRDEFMQNLQREMHSKRVDLMEVKSSITSAEKRLGDVHLNIKTLSDQLNNLEQQAIATRKLIKDVRLRIAGKENKINVLYETIDVKKVEIADQKAMILDYLQVLYERENGMMNTFEGNEEANMAKLLLSDQPIGDQIKELEYFGILKKQSYEIFHKLDKLIKEYDSDVVELEKQRVELKRMYKVLGEQEENLDIQKKAKIELIKETRGEEAIYQELLERSKKQQAEIEDDISLFREHLVFIQKKMVQDGSEFDANRYSGILSGEKVSVYNFINETRDDTSDIVLDWPINPSRGISAYFHDPSYYAVFGVQHQACSSWWIYYCLWAC